MRHTLFELPAANLVVKITTAAEIQIQNNDPLHPMIRLIKPYGGPRRRADRIRRRDSIIGLGIVTNSGYVECAPGAGQVEVSDLTG
jgi:hypothetical protein